MAIEYEFTRINPLCLCDESNNLKTQKLEVSMRAKDTTSHGTVLEAYANGEVVLTGAACVAPDALDLTTLCNGLATENNWKASLASGIANQKESAHEWTGHLAGPAVT
ncbi:MAG: hypothetical protein VX237_09430 [Chloroflexota bacterium]|nr:hypothetical protein [Chloroflexota bacterium]